MDLQPGSGFPAFGLGQALEARRVFYKALFANPMHGIQVRRRGMRVVTGLGGCLPDETT